jgi:uroporphyrinogen-III synthase
LPQPDGDLNLGLSARAIMVVSAQAARVFARQDLAWASHVQDLWAQGLGPRIWAPGPGTRRALLAAGVPEARIDTPPLDAAQFDSQHLWPVVASQLRPGDRVMIVRGQGQATAGLGRDFLQQACEDVGAQVHIVRVYRRSAPRWSEVERADFERARAQASSLWLFSSSQALRYAAQVGGTPQATPWWTASTVVATHPRIADTARAMGWARVALSAPLLPDIVETLQALRAATPERGQAHG